MHFCCSHYISSCFLSTPPFHSLSLSLAFSFSLSLFLSLSLFISAPSFSLWLQDTCHLMPFTKNSLLDQSYFFHTISFTLFTDYLLRLPSSELLEKHLFRSRANRRLVPYVFLIHPYVSPRFPSCVSQGLASTPCRGGGGLATLAAAMAGEPQ